MPFGARVEDPTVDSQHKDSENETETFAGSDLDSGSEGGTQSEDKMGSFGGQINEVQSRLESLENEFRVNRGKQMNESKVGLRLDSLEKKVAKISEIVRAMSEDSRQRSLRIRAYKLETNKTLSKQWAVVDDLKSEIVGELTALKLEKRHIRDIAVEARRLEQERIGEQRRRDEIEVKLQLDLAKLSLRKNPKKTDALNLVEEVQTTKEKLYKVLNEMEANLDIGEENEEMTSIQADLAEGLKEMKVYMASISEGAQIVASQYNETGYRL